MSQFWRERAEALRLKWQQLLTEVSCGEGGPFDFNAAKLLSCVTCYESPFHREVDHYTGFNLSTVFSISQFQITGTQLCVACTCLTWCKLNLTKETSYGENKTLGEILPWVFKGLFTLQWALTYDPAILALQSGGGALRRWPEDVPSEQSGRLSQTRDRARQSPTGAGAAVGRWQG